MKVLILCTGNSCRSQMAEAFLKSFDSNLEVYSAGTKPAEYVNENTIQVMKEIGLDLSGHSPKSVDEFLSFSFDYVITVCDNAKETCPVFTGKVKTKLHIGFEDPTDTIGNKEEIRKIFRKIRDEINFEFIKFYKNLELDK